MHTIEENKDLRLTVGSKAMGGKVALRVYYCDGQIYELEKYIDCKPVVYRVECLRKRESEYLRIDGSQTFASGLSWEQAEALAFPAIVAYAAMLKAL